MVGRSHDDAPTIREIIRRLDMLESSIQTLSQATNGLTTGQALLEYRSEHAAELTNQLRELIDRLHAYRDQELVKVVGMLEMYETKTVAAIKSHQEDATRLVDERHSSLHQRINNIEKTIESLETKLIDKLATTTNKVDGIQRWIWAIVAGGAVIVWILENAIDALTSIFL